MIDNQIVYESFFDIDPSYYPVMTEDLSMKTMRNGKASIP